MKPIHKVILFLIAIFASGIFIFSTTNNAKVKGINGVVIYTFPVKLNFAGKITPLKISDVKERFDRDCWLM